eukprot:s3194_g1.t1
MSNLTAFRSLVLTNASETSDGIPRLTLEPLDTSADPAVWMMTEGSNFTLSRPYWNCGSKVVEAGLGQDWFFCSGSDGTIRIVDQSTGRLVYAAREPRIKEKGLNSGSLLEKRILCHAALKAVQGVSVAAWRESQQGLHGVSDAETPPPLPQLECRLLSDKFVSEVVPGRRLSKDEASCDLPSDLNFLRRDKYLPAATYPASASVANARICRAESCRIQFLPQLRVVAVNPAAAAVNLVTETVNLTMEPPDAGEPVSSTGPSGRAYILNLSWVSLTTARCGPLTTSHPFPSLHRLKLEVSPNGVQWFLAPRPITLFEQPQFHSMSPLLAAALRVNSTALRFRSPTSSTAMNASIWVTFGGAPAKNTGFILRLVDSPSVTSVSPPAISVGEPQGTDTRRPINIYGLNFRDTDECIFQSASMVQPERYISSTHVQCRAPGVALSDALVPPYTPEEVDACEVYAYLQTRINSLRDQVNAMKAEPCRAHDHR